MNLVQLLTPINLAEEKERFFSSSTYQPVFRYERDQNKIDTWLKKQPHYRPLVNAVLSEDNRKIVKAASKLFQTKVSQPSLSKAKEIINQTKPSILKTDNNKLSQNFKKLLLFSILTSV